MNRLNRVWIVRMLSGNPFDYNSTERSVGFASYLSKKGYDVTYWGTAFDHSTKQYIFPKTTRKSVNENEEAVMINVSTVYKKNISISRLIYSFKQACALKKELNNEVFKKPDIIFAAYPTASSCRVLEQYGKKNKIPVVVDQRDRWPDVFENAFPEKIRFLAKFLLIPLKLQAHQVFRNADALCGMSPTSLEYALSYAKREKTSLDKYVYIGRKKHVPSESVREEYLNHLEKIGITNRTWNICLFTSLSKVGLDGDSMIEGIKKIHESFPEVRLIVGGSGDDSERLNGLTKNLPFIVFCGWLNDDQMSTIMSISKVGLMPYKNSVLRNAWGNKIGQYFSYGLPILTSTEGVAKEYFEKYKCGLKYEEGNPDSLADTIGYLINNPSILSTLSSNAKERFSLDFEYDVVMKKMEKMILDVYNTFD